MGAKLDGIVTVGFNFSELTPRKMVKVIQDEYLDLRNDFCKWWNAIEEEVNKSWKDGFEEGYQEQPYDILVYYHMISNYMGDIVDQINLEHPDGYLLAGVYFGEEGKPTFYCRIKQHPDLKIRDKKSLLGN